jgi:hypothetical protein
MISRARCTVLQFTASAIRQINRSTAFLAHCALSGSASGTESTIYSGAMEDEDVWGFEANGKQYEVHVCYPSVPYSENFYQIYEDGKKLGGRMPNTQNTLECAERIANEYGAPSVYPIR